MISSGDCLPSHWTSREAQSRVDKGCTNPRAVPGSSQLLLRGKGGRKPAIGHRFFARYSEAADERCNGGSPATLPLIPQPFPCSETAAPPSGSTAWPPPRGPVLKQAFAALSSELRPREVRRSERGKGEVEEVEGGLSKLRGQLDLRGSSEGIVSPERERRERMAGTPTSSPLFSPKPQRRRFDGCTLTHVLSTSS